VEAKGAVGTRQGVVGSPLAWGGEPGAGGEGGRVCERVWGITPDPGRCGFYLVRVFGAATNEQDWRQEERGRWDREVRPSDAGNAGSRTTGEGAGAVRLKGKG